MASFKPEQKKRADQNYRTLLMTDSICLRREQDEEKRRINAIRCQEVNRSMAAEKRARAEQELRAAQNSRQDRHTQANVTQSQQEQLQLLQDRNEELEAGCQSLRLQLEQSRDQNSLLTERTLKVERKVVSLTCQLESLKLELRGKVERGGGTFQGQIDVPSTRRRRSSWEESLDFVMELLAALQSRPRPPLYSVDKCFLIGLLPSLQKLPSQLKESVKYEMSKLVYEKSTVLPN